MPRNPNKWIEMPPQDAGMMFRTGKQLWRTARDLQEPARAMPDAQVPIDQSSLAWGSGLSAPALFVTETRSWAVPGTQSCVYVNPPLDPSVLPSALLRLLHAQGKDCSERIEGESIASIQGIN